MDDIGLDRQIVANELAGERVVDMSAPDPGGCEKNVSGAFIFEQRCHRACIGQVAFGVCAGDDVRMSRRSQRAHDGRTDQTAMAGDLHDVVLIHDSRRPRSRGA